MSWRRLRTLLQREARATYRDTFTMSILVGVPLAALLVFSFTLSTEVNGIRLGVLDASRTSASRRLVAELAAQGTFTPVAVATPAELERGLVSSSLSVALVIPPDFDRLLRAGAPGAEALQIEVLYDGAESVLAENAEAFLRSLVASTMSQLAAGHAGAPGAAANASSQGVHVVSRALFNPTLDGHRYMVSGTFGFVLSFLTTLITAVSIVNERLQGTFEQLQVTPATSLEILLGKILPLGLVFAGDVVLMLLAAGVFIGIWPEGSILFFVAVSAFYVLTSLAMGLIFSATSATPAEAVQKTVLFSIPLVQLSGFVFPTRNMPTLVRWVTELFPATHYIRISRAVYMRGEGPLTLLPELGALVLFAGLLITVALRTMESRA